MRAWSRRAVLRAGGLAAGAWGLGQGRWLLGQEGAAAGPMVKTPLGELRGAMVQGGVRVFKGVPFAQPPVGELRFRPTLAAKAWTGVRSATAFQSVAVQTNGGAVEGSEDCLYLNVWAPAGAGPFPVYVWIHGGGYTGGSAIAPVFDGAEFAREGVVLVTVAYRLGVFGFLDVGPLLGPEYAGSGNNAIRDLVMSLKWVQENIAAFGGDRERVTIGGESAGAKATAALMGIREARGYFQAGDLGEWGRGAGLAEGGGRGGGAGVWGGVVGGQAGWSCGGGAAAGAEDGAGGGADGGAGAADQKLGAALSAAAGGGRGLPDGDADGGGGRGDGEGEADDHRDEPG